MHDEIYSFGFIGDAGRDTKTATKLRNSLLHSNVRRLINAGDNLYSYLPDLAGRVSHHLKNILPHNSYEEVWGIWKQLGFDFFATAIGNHYKTLEEEIRYFDLPGPFYSKIVSGVVRFIVLNSNDGAHATEQAVFLANELDQATEPFVFVLYHHTPFTLLKVFHSSEANLFHKPINPVLIMYRHKITALLLGHEHIALLASFFDIPCIVNGAGQGTAPWSPLLAGKEATILWYSANHPYWVDLQLNMTKKLAYLSYVNADDNKIKCQITIRTGHPVQQSYIPKP